MWAKFAAKADVDRRPAEGCFLLLGIGGDGVGDV